MNVRDRAVVGGLVLILTALSLAVGWPAVVPAASVAASPSPQPSEAVPVYREGFVGRPLSVSPFGERSAAGHALVALVFSSLVRLGPGDTLVPDLAESWTVSDDGATYTFTLRPDAVWQDGVPVTAHDVEFTIDTMKDPNYTGPGAGSWRDVTVTALDDRTVRFDLANPIAGFLDAATQPIAPAHLLEGIDPSLLPANAFGQQPVGSGPYRLVSLHAGSATLEAAALPSTEPAVEATPGVDSLASPSPAPTPSRPSPYIPRIEFTFSLDPQALADQYRAGKLDAVSGLPPQLAAALGAQVGSRLIRYPGSTLTAVVLNLRPSRTAFRDPRTRRALLEAIDRDAIVASQYAGLAARADAPIPPTSWAFDPAVSVEVPFDQAKAKKDLVAGGWKELSKGWAAPGSKSATTIQLVAPDQASSPTTWAVANAVADAWRAIGLRVDVTGLPPARLVTERLEPGDFDAALIDLNLGLDPDLYPLLASSQTLAGGSNVSGLQDPTLDAKLEAARRPGPEADRVAAYKDLQTYLAKEQFLLPVAFADTAVVASDAVQGPVPRQVSDPADRFYDVLTWRLADGR